MTKMKGAAILGGLLLAGATLLSSFPAAGVSSFLPVKPRQLQAACRALNGADGGLCSVTANLLKSIGSVDPDTPIPPATVKQGLRTLRPYVYKGLRQTCCDGPCVRQCSVSETRCFSDANCPGGETCLPCPTTCQTPCSEFKGDRCAGCIQMMSNLQSWLATNGSAQLLADSLAGACAAQFDDPTQCEDTLRTTAAQVIDRFLANLPPQTTCDDSALRSSCQ
jgi:hypothetical protein